MYIFNIARILSGKPYKNTGNKYFAGFLKGVLIRKANYDYYVVL
jgi:hypothetical protein